MISSIEKIKLNLPPLQLKIKETAHLILPPEDFDAKYIGVMEREYFSNHYRPTKSGEQFALSLRLVVDFPKYKNVLLRVGMEKATIIIDGKPLPDDYVKSKQKHIETMMDLWEEVTKLRAAR